MALWSWYQYSKEVSMIGFTNDRDYDDNNIRTYDFLIINTIECLYI